MLPVLALVIALTAGMAVNTRLTPDTDPPDNLEKQKAAPATLLTTNTIDASFRAPVPTARSFEASTTVRNDTDLSHSNGPVDTGNLNEWHEIIVRPHDTLSATFERLNLDHHPTHRFGAHKLHGESKLKTVNEEPASCVFAASGRITKSLWQTAQTAGLSEKIVMELVKLFAWDIDFALDIRKGDSFAVIFEQYRDGVRIDVGGILAAEFVNQDTRYRAIRFKDDTGREEYYSEEGKSPRKAFLRTPVNFARISSYFNLKRKHPILNRIRAHRGVDYAAPQGTPVKATGDGQVVFVGVNGGYGKTVVLQHGEEYSTLYAHLSRFAGGVRRGKVVRQGELIGLVGQTGLATGSHLHYEFRVSGVHQNPLTAKLPRAAPLSRAQLAAFKSHTAPVLAKLDEIAGELAKGGPSTTQELTDRRLLAMTAERVPTSFSR